MMIGGPVATVVTLEVITDLEITGEGAALIGRMSTQLLLHRAESVRGCS